MEKNIYPIFDKLQSREDKERLLGQRGMTIWFTGYSGSGKSTIAVALERLLSSEGYVCKILDGDNIRSGLNSDLGFSHDDRIENIRRIAEVCRLFNSIGVIVIASFVTPTEDLRSLARKTIGNDDYFEVWVSTSLEECERRDVKGLYAKARAGMIQNFTGIDAPFDIPESPSITVDTEDSSPEECVKAIYDIVRPRITADSIADVHDEKVCL